MITFPEHNLLKEKIVISTSNSKSGANKHFKRRIFFKKSDITIKNIFSIQGTYFSIFVSICLYDLFTDNLFTGQQNVDSQPIYIL